MAGGEERIGKLLAKRESGYPVVDEWRREAFDLIGIWVILWTASGKERIGKVLAKT